MSNSVILRVQNNVTYIDGKLDSDIYKGLKKCLGYLPEDHLWMIKSNNEKEGQESWRKEWDGWISTICYNKKYCKCFEKKEGTHFPTGLISKAIIFLQDKKVIVDIEDIRERYNTNLNLQLGGDYEEREYQIEAIKKIASKDRGLIAVATGGGKSFIAAGVIAAKNVSPVIYYVPSIDLLTQTKNELERFIYSNNIPIEVGQIGNGKRDIKDITVMTIQTAVRMLGGKYVKYDDEEIIQENNTDISDMKNNIVDLIKSSKLLVADECLDGDTLIRTEKGTIPISKVFELNCKYVLSHDGNKKIWKKITAFMPKGKKKVLKITLNSGRQIRCTSNHPFMTKEGWVEAQKLFTNKEVFVCEQKKNGNKYIKHLSKMPHYANVDVVNKSNLNVQLLKHLLKAEEAVSIVNLFMDTIRDLKIGILSYLSMKNKLYLALYWETLACHTLQKEALIQDYDVTIVQNKNYGLNIKQREYLFYLQNYQNNLMEDMEKKLFHYILLVILLLQKFIQLLTLINTKKLIQNGLTVSDMLDWHGGYVTMEAEEEIILDYILKDTQKKKLKSFSYGYKTNLEKLVCLNQKENTIQSLSEKKLYKKYSLKSKNTSRTVCDIKFETVLSVEEDGFSNVFDIEVEDTHCFFANDILVHNCQHWSAETCQIISDASVSARYKYGMSGTIFRDKNDDILIEACFGKPIININASFLIKKGYLVKPIIYFIPMKNVSGPKKRTYPNIYKYAIVENEKRNYQISQMAIKLKEEHKKNILILCKHIKHGQLLEKIIPGSVFLHGLHSGKKRKEHLDKMRKGESLITISSVIFDEGINVPSLDTLILAGSGQSKTRALQRIGRILRPYPNKTEAIVIDFMDNCKYLKEQSQKRKSIYKTEPEFQIEIVENI